MIQQQKVCLCFNDLFLDNLLIYLLYIYKCCLQVEGSAHGVLFIDVRSSDPTSDPVGSDGFGSPVARGVSDRWDNSSECGGTTAVSTNSSVHL